MSVATGPAGPSPEHLVLGTTRRQWSVLAVVAGLVAALAGGVVLGRVSAGGRAVTDRVDIGFARDMSVHHAQAVEMSSIAYVRTSDPAVRYLAFDILTSQQGQIGRMSGWLQLWNQTPTDPSEIPMAWMGEPHSSGMPGMATRAQVAALRTARQSDVDEQFLRLMIRHHRGALPMADFATAHASSSAMRDLAETMSSGQSAEIDLMQRMLVERGHAEEPESHDGMGPMDMHG